MNEKEKGKTNIEIYNALLNKGLNENSAYMLIDTLESKSKELIDIFDTEIIIGWVVLAAGLVTLYLAAIDTLKAIIGLYGVIGIIGGTIRLFISYSKKKKYQTIANNIEEEKDNLNNLYQ